MNARLFTYGILAACGLLALSSQATCAPAADGPVYELRIYTCEPGRLDALHTRFREHTIKFFEQHGMTNVAYWTPIEGPRAGNTLIYLLKHDSRDAAAASWAAFRADPEWIRVRDDSEKDGKILAQPPESIYMSATDYSPPTGPARRDRIYELRIYTAADGKLPALHDRFRQHTDKLFAQHGMKSCGYWSPLDEPRSQHDLLYVLEYENRDAARAAWREFAADPAWQEVVAETEADGKLVTKVESIYMQATPYSPTK